MTTGRETFRKSERLCSNKVLNGLFENGNIFYTKLFKVVWEQCPPAGPFPARIAFSVSKRNFRLAVTRNLIKRRMREAYRRNKKTLYDLLSAQNTGLVFAVIYIEKRVPDYHETESSITEMIEKLTIKIKESLNEKK